MTNLYNILVGKHERKVQLAIFRHRRARECNIEMDVKKIRENATAFSWLRIGSSGRLRGKYKVVQI